MRIALAQINATVGDIAGNARADPRAARRGPRGRRRSSSSSPSSRVTGYPPEDLLLKEHFLRRRARRAGPDRRPTPRGIVAVVGFPERAEDVYNAAAVLADGAVQAIYRKVHLPNYGVFDEVRYFQAGRAAAIDRGRRRQGRPDDLRGHLGAGPAG